MPKKTIISIDYNWCADLFNTVGLDKKERSHTALYPLTSLSPILNKVLLSFRDGLKASLSSLSTGHETELYNLSLRQSRRLEHREMAVYRNGDSTCTLPRVSRLLGDKTKVSHLLLADGDNHLQAGDSLRRDTFDDCDTFYYDVSKKPELERVLSVQLEHIKDMHGTETCELIIISPNAAKAAQFIESIKNTIPSNITIKVIEFDWHQILKKHIQQNAAAFLYNLSTAVRLINKLINKQTKIIKSTFTTRRAWDSLHQLKSETFTFLSQLSGDYHELSPLKDHFNYTQEYSIDELKAIKSHIGTITEEFIKNLADKDCTEISKQALSNVVLETQGTRHHQLLALK